MGDSRVRFLFILWMLPFLAFGSGVHPQQKASVGTNYDRLPAGIQLYAATAGYSDGSSCGDGQVGGTSINVAFYGGTGAANIWAQTNVAGIQLRLRWCAIETSQGVYTYTTPDNIISQVSGYGGKFAIYLIHGSYSGSNSNIPAYIVSDNATYGGSVSHGGELLRNSGVGYQPNWSNAAFLARFEALIDSLATKYKSTASYIYIDELFDSGLSRAALGYATEADLIATFETILSYCQTAFGSTPCFTKFNYIDGDNYPTSDGMRSIINWCSGQTNCGFAQELAMPLPYDKKFPLPAGTTIANANITTWAGLSTGFPSTRPRIWNTEYSTTSTWDTTYSPTDAATFLRYIASLTTPYVASGTPVFYALTATNGINTSSGAWYGMGNLVTSGFLR